MKEKAKTDVAEFILREGRKGKSFLHGKEGPHKILLQEGEYTGKRKSTKGNERPYGFES